MNEAQLRAAIAWVSAVMRSMVADADGAAIVNRTDDAGTVIDDAADRFEAGRSAIAEWQAELDTIVEQRNAVAALPAESGAAPAPAGTGTRTAPHQGTRHSDADVFTLRGIDSLGRPAADVARDLRSRALTAIERVADVFVDSDHAETITRHIERNDGRGVLAQRVITTMSPDYRSAFPALVAGELVDLTEEQRAAIRAVRAVQGAGSDGAGGYAVPTHLDPTMVLTSAGTINPLRQLARVISLSVGNTWNGVSTAGVSAGFDAELAVQGDDAPTLAQLGGIVVKRADAFVPFSIEAEQDIDGLAEMLLMLFAEAKDDLEAAAHMTGTGSGNQPTGLITALVAASKVLATAGSETLAISDIYALLEAVPNRHRGSDRFSWLGNLSTINDIRELGTSDNRFITDLSGDTPRQLVGRNLFEASEMHGTVTGAAENYALVGGNIRAAFAIVDRMGMNVERVQHTFDPTTGRPKGERGLSAIWRNGSGALNADAARVLNIT